MVVDDDSLSAVGNLVVKGGKEPSRLAGVYVSHPVILTYLYESYNLRSAWSPEAKPPRPTRSPPDPFAVCGGCLADEALEESRHVALIREAGLGGDVAQAAFGLNDPPARQLHA